MAIEGCGLGSEVTALREGRGNRRGPEPGRVPRNLAGNRLDAELLHQEYPPKA
jgi:hypothetical protein